MQIHYNEIGQIKIENLNAAEMQVIYNALNMYRVTYGRDVNFEESEGYNSNHAQLAEEMFERYQSLYLDDNRP